MPVKTRKRDPETNRRARQLRHGDNMAEAILWNELKASKLGGHKFVRQMPIGPYFADFACRSAKLIVELDGSHHADSDYDRRRDEFMRADGYSVLRFWSHDALKHVPSVCETILAAIEGRLAENAISVDLRFVMAKAGKDHAS
jgi:very-short-patch-repair endonuclease